MSFGFTLSRDRYTRGRENCTSMSPSLQCTPFEKTGRQPGGRLIDESWVLYMRENIVMRGATHERFAAEVPRARQLALTHLLPIISYYQHSTRAARAATRGRLWRGTPIVRARQCYCCLGVLMVDQAFLFFQTRSKTTNGVPHTIVLPAQQYHEGVSGGKQNTSTNCKTRSETKTNNSALVKGMRSVERDNQPCPAPSRAAKVYLANTTPSIGRIRKQIRRTRTAPLFFSSRFPRSQACSSCR